MFAFELYCFKMVIIEVIGRLKKKKKITNKTYWNRTNRSLKSRIAHACETFETMEMNRKTPKKKKNPIYIVVHRSIREK